MKKTIIKTIFITLAFVNCSYAVEIIPLAGLRGGGEFIDQSTEKTHTVATSDIYGLILSFPYEYGKTLEMYYSHQSSDLNSISINTSSPTGKTDIPLTIDYLHIGGTAPIVEEKQFKSFVTGGLGFTYMSPDFPDAESDLRASFSIGIGLKWPITERIAVRLETRGLATVFNSSSTIFCNGGCTIKVKGNLFVQGEVFAGLGIKF